MLHATAVYSQAATVLPIGRDTAGALVSLPKRSSSNA